MKKKLTLNRQTLRDLEASKLTRVHGGVATLVVDVCGVVGPMLSKLKLNCNMT